MHLSVLLGRSFAGSVSPQEEEEFRRLAALPNIYELISKSISPSIFGGMDMKKAIACLLFGGSRKRWGAWEEGINDKVASEGHLCWEPSFLHVSQVPQPAGMGSTVGKH